MAQHNQLGKKGEQLAVDYLLKNDYSIIERNFRFDKAEVDIIARKGDSLAIIEVKTRSTIDFGNAAQILGLDDIDHQIKVKEHEAKKDKLKAEKEHAWMPQREQQMPCDEHQYELPKIWWHCQSKCES